MAVKISLTHPSTSTLRITGMDCPDCALTIEKKVRAVEGIKTANINFATSKLVMEMEPGAVTLDKIIQVVDDAGYEAEPEASLAQVTAKPAGHKLHRRDLLTIVSGGFVALGFAASFLGQPTEVVTALYFAAIVTGGYYTARRGISAARSLSLDINFLMTVAVIGAATIGEWAEGAMVVFLFSLANSLEAYTVSKTRNSIQELMELAPNEATVKHEGHYHRRPVAEIQVGEVLIVRPGERIAMDGVVVAGVSSVNQATITGESIPVEKRQGDSVFAGTINERGSLEVEVTKPFEDNTLSKIIHLIEEAQAQRAPSQQFIDRFAKYYTPAVIAFAIGVAVLPPLLFGQPWNPWIYRALALLVVSCPCALVISTPVSIVSAIANASRHGVLIKGGAHLEETGRISVVAFDKTGTLTNGSPEVTEIIPLNGHSTDEILGIAASVERHSKHPLAQAILHKARDEEIPWRPAHEFESLSGLGVRARVAGTTYFLGSAKLFEDMGLSSEASILSRLNGHQTEGKTIVLLGTENQLLGALAIADELRETSAEALAQLHRRGIKRIVMLTGDNEVTARAIASRLGIDEYYAGLMPEDKVGAVRDLLSSHGKVAMVGDGVNDAPALATSTVGIAMGTAGSDAALETADIALMADDLSKVPYVVGLSRRTLRIVKQNILLALFVKTLFLALAFPGWLTLWLAVVGDMGVSLLVIANGMRLLRTEK
jgi:Cd2+/Zn2+-exporting ATPase